MVITETTSSKCGSATTTDDLLQAYEQISKATRSAKALKDKVHIEQQQEQQKSSSCKFRTSERNTTKTTLMMEEEHPDDRRDDSIGHNGTNTTSTSTTSTSSRRRRGNVVFFNDVVQVTNIPRELLDHQPSDEIEDDDGRYGDDERDDNSCSIGGSSTYDSSSDFSSNNHEEELFDMLSSNSSSLMEDIVEGELLEKGGYWKGLGDLIGGVPSDDDDVLDVDSLNVSTSVASSTTSCSDNDSCDTTDPTQGNGIMASATTATTPSSSVLVKNPNTTTDLAIINTTETSCLNMLFDEIVGNDGDISQCSFCGSSCGSSSTNNNDASHKFEATALTSVAPANSSNNKAPDTAEVTTTSSSMIAVVIPKLLEEITDILPTCVRDPCLFDEEAKHQNQSQISTTEDGGNSNKTSTEGGGPTQSTLDLIFSIEDVENDENNNANKKVQIPNKEEKSSPTSDNDQTKNADNTTKTLPIEVTKDESDDTTLFFLEDPNDAIEDQLQRGLSNVFANLNVNESSGSTDSNNKNNNQELLEAKAVAVSSSTQREHHLQQIYDVSSTCVTAPSQGDDESHFIEDQAIVVTHGGFGSDPEDTTTRFFRLYDGASDDDDNFFSTHPSDCDAHIAPIINKGQQEEGRDVDDENQIRNIIDWHQSPTSCVTHARSTSSTMMAGEWIVNKSTSNNSTATKNDDVMPSQGNTGNHMPYSQKHHDNIASGTQGSAAASTTTTKISSKAEKLIKKEQQALNTNIYESSDSHDIWKDIIDEKEGSSNCNYRHHDVDKDDDNYDGHMIETNNTSSTAATVKTRGASVLTAPPQMFSEEIFDGLEEEDNIPPKKSTSKENTKSIDDDKNETGRPIASSPSALEPHLEGLDDQSNSLLKDPENTNNDHEVSIPIAKESSKINLRIKTDVSHDEMTKSETPRESALKKLSMNCEDCETPTISSPVAREAALKKLDFIARGRKKGQDNQECRHRQKQSCDKESEPATTSPTTYQKGISDCEDKREPSTARVKSLDTLKVDTSRGEKCLDDEHGQGCNALSPASTTSPTGPINKRTPSVAKRRRIFPNVKYLDEDALRFCRDGTSTTVSPTSTNQEGLSPVSDVQLSTPCYKFTGISPTFTATKQRKANDDKDESSFKLLTERFQGKPLYAQENQSPSSSEEHTGKPEKFEENKQEENVNLASKTSASNQASRVNDTDIPASVSSFEIKDISNNGGKNKQPGDGDRQTKTSANVPTTPICSSIEITDISDYVDEKGLRAHVASTNTRSYEDLIISPCSIKGNGSETSPTAIDQENTKRELDVSDCLDENERPEDEDFNNEAAVLSPTAIGQVGPMHPTDLQVEATASCIEISVAEYKQEEDIRPKSDNLDIETVDTEMRRQDEENVAMDDGDLLSPSLARASMDGVGIASSGPSTLSDDSFVSSLVLDRKIVGIASSGPSTRSDDSFVSSLVLDRKTVGTEKRRQDVNDEEPSPSLANMDGVGTATSVRSAPSDEYFEDKLSSLELEINSLKDQLLRSLEEQESMRQIAKRGDATLAKKDAIKSFAISLSEISNNLQRALDTVPEEVLFSSVDDGSIKAFQTRGIQASCCLQELRDVFHQKHEDADTRFDDDTTIDTGECKAETTSTDMGSVSNNQDEVNPTGKAQNPSSKDCGVFHFAVDAAAMEEPTSRKTEIKPELTQPTQIAGELSKQQEISAIKTDAGELAKVFNQALIVVNKEPREIHVGKLLFACEKLSQAIRNVGIIPSADDIMSNVQKVRTAYDCFPHEDRRNSIMAIIQHELDTGVHSNPQKIFTENSAAMGFLWIARNINYQHFLFSHVLQNKDEEPYDAALYAYERAMKPHLPWMLQQVGLAVLIILKPMSKSLIYTRIGGFEDDKFGTKEERATIRDIQLVVDSWKPIIAQCRKVFSDLNLEHKI